MSVGYRYHIFIINGPLMNTIGYRETDKYGSMNLEDINRRISELGLKKQIQLSFYQSNHEGDIVDYLVKNREVPDGIILNPASLTINGYSIMETLSFIKKPFIEVHMTNIFNRGGWHANSIFSKMAEGLVIGFQSYVYDYALLAMLHYLEGDGTGG